MSGLAGQRILLGVTGGIAAYKAADLARRLQDAGADVQVVMTDAAQQFVTPMTFQALTGHPVRGSLWDAGAEAAMGHIELARWADRILIAPASADAIARLAAGLAGDLLGTLCLATEAPIAIAPAMNRVMWAHPATQTNLATLRARGVQVIGPGEGDQACGEVGAGRMLEPLQIVAALQAQPMRGALAGLRILISAGPTFEDLDPVRFIGNRSSGKMGFALAAEAVRMGAEVTLVAGPVALPSPPGLRRVDVRGALQMRDAVLAALPGQDAFIAAAAVADFMPAQAALQKLKKSAGTPELALVPTPDILAEVSAHPHRPRLLVGFAAETEALEANALDKLKRKGLDFVAANQVGVAGTGFESDDNALSLYSTEGRQDIARAPKSEVARQLLQILAARLAAKS
jgi:phosphopantothenoylcysteine decarboxylase/phosphopantothenate--cysteine ligase